MTLKRTTFLTSGFLFVGFFLLLVGCLVLPASARSHRAHGLLAPKATASTLSYATVLRGRASWYGREHQGQRTSSGERFNRFKYTCAHKTLPFGTRLRVTNVKTGKSVVVRVSDRGPFRHQRILDLAEVAARPLGIVQQGAASIIAQVVPATTPLGPATSPLNLLALQAADPNPAAAFTTYQLARPADSLAALVPAFAQAQAADSAAGFLLQAGTFATLPEAQAMRARILVLDPTLVVELKPEIIDNQLAHRVLIGRLTNWLEAETVRRHLQMGGVFGQVRPAPSQPVAMSTAMLPMAGQ